MRHLFSGKAADSGILSKNSVTSASVKISLKHFLLGIAMAIVPTGTGMVLANRQEPRVADPTPSKEFVTFAETTTEPTPTPPPTLIAKPTSSPSLKSNLLPTPTPTPITDLYELTDRFAGQYGVDANVLRHIARCESGFNPQAINGPYAGLYQFSAPTWRSNRDQMGLDPDPDLRTHAEEAIRTAAWMLSVNKAYSWPNCLP